MKRSYIDRIKDVEKKVKEIEENFERKIHTRIQTLENGLLKLSLEIKKEDGDKHKK